MARTTDAAVILILFNYDATIALTSFIEVANDIVTDVCVDSTDYTYTTEKLELVERWLSAHFYEIRQARVIRESAGSVSEQKSSKVDLGLDLTRYGQMVKRIDTQGNMAAFDVRSQKGGQKRTAVIWMGTGDSTGDDTSE